MEKIRNIPVGIKLFIAVILIFKLYYYVSQLIYPLYTDVITNSWFFSFTTLNLLFWIDAILTIILLYAVTIGFYRLKNWARLYTIFYLFISSLGALAMIYYFNWKIFEWYLYFVLYVVLIMYLNMSNVKTYFIKGNDSVVPKRKEHVYRHGEYTLYTTEVKLRSGKTQNIYFFSKKIPEHGKPCDIPNDYTIGINSKTGMPFLKKKK
jgi:hypothetical protein